MTERADDFSANKTPDTAPPRPDTGLPRHRSAQPQPDQPIQGVTSGPKTLRELQAANRALGARNAKLVEMLQASKAKLADINARLAEMSEPPSTFGTLLRVGPYGKTAEVFTANRRMLLQVSPLVAPSDLVPGVTVRLAEGQQVVEVTEVTDFGDVAQVVEVVGDRVIIADRMGEETVVKAAGSLREDLLRREVTPGDSVIVDRRSGWAFEALPRTEVTSLVLEEVPDVTYADIGGLASQIEQIRDAVELPFLHPDIYRDYGLRPPKGVLLYGPPGNGKTLIAKAVANSLSQSMGARGATTAADSPEHGGEAPESFFLNVKGPELLNKFVGETERQIRQIFERARRIAHSGRPVIIFFDEMEAIFRTRGSGVSSDMESTVVPQLLSELDGVEGLENVIVIGASNREELIDPAILRPGRLDVKIRVERPNPSGARDILSKYLTDSIPLDPALVEQTGSKAAAAEDLRNRIVETLFRREAEQRYATLHFADGSRQDLYWSDLVSGAMLSNIVDRAKTAAIKEALQHGKTHPGETTSTGISVAHITAAVHAEVRDNEDLPDTSNPAEWARISGHIGGRVVDITLPGAKAAAEEEER